jgi:hypothetical protein
MVRAEASRFSPRIGRSRDFNRPWSVSMVLLTSMKISASPVPLAAHVWRGVTGRHTVRPSGTGAPGVKQGGQAGVTRWAESPSC